MLSHDDFGNALRKLQGSMDNLATSTIRARKREFAPVEITTGRTESSNRPDDHHLFCTDKQARDAEFARRKVAAVDNWYFDLAGSSQPMREITEVETRSLHKQVEELFVRELNEYLYHYPETEYKN
ncbi:UNVERIFIED_CONTAM: hypothetical protein DES50_11450 [Williamsia faeni]